jgi:hypothetical protein
MSDFGNLSKPDDLCSRALYEIFSAPSRAFTVLHCAFGLNILIFTFYALYQKRGVGVFLCQELAALAMMWESLAFTLGLRKGSVRSYAFVNQMRSA